MAAFGERYVSAKREKPPAWRRLLLVVSLVLHGVVGAAFIVYSFWKIEKVEPQNTVVTLRAIAAPPPPAAAAPPKSSTKKKKEKKVVKKNPDALVQPKEKQEPEEEVDTEFDGLEGGVVGGVEGGVVGGEVGGIVGGSIGGTGNAPAEPQIVPQALLSGSRIAGDEKCKPPSSVVSVLATQSEKSDSAVVKLCVSADGKPTGTSFIKKSRFPAWDAAIEQCVAQWRYKPYKVNGRAVPYCTPVTFKFRLN